MLILKWQQIPRLKFRPTSLPFNLADGFCSKVYLFKKKLCKENSLVISLSDAAEDNLTNKARLKHERFDVDYKTEKKHKSSQRAHMSIKENMVWIRSGVVMWWTLDPDYFQNLTGISLFKDTSVIKFLSKCDDSGQSYEPNCVKMPYLAMLKKPSQKFLYRDPDPEADDYQNLSVLPCAQTHLW